MSNRGRLGLMMAAILVCGFAATAFAADASVPDVVGLQLDEARDLIQKAGFDVDVRPVQGHPIGLVVSQEPGGMCVRSKGVKVVLQVGGPTPKPGMDMAPPRSEPSASKPSDDLGAPPAGAVDQPVRPPTVRPGTRVPISRAPSSAGGRLPSGTDMAIIWQGRAIPEGTLPNENGPEVPSVLGQSAQQARAALANWNVNVEQTLAVPALVGKVVNQMPFAGSRLAARETVTLVVAVAQVPSPDYVFVPQAGGKYYLEGLASLQDSGLRPRPFSVSSTAKERGRILAQFPHTGSLAAPGSDVRVLIGRGPGPYSTDMGGMPVLPRPSEPTPSDPTPSEPTAPTMPDDAPPAGTPPAPIPDEPPTPMPERPEPRPEPPTPAPMPAPGPDEPPAPAAILAAPSLGAPPAGESYPYKYGADFSWSTISGADGYELELQEEQPSGAWTSTGIFQAAGPKYRPAKLDRGRYRWRVRAVSGQTKGSWSEFRRLYMY